MDSDIFIDTSGFYAVVVSGDSAHEEAVGVFEDASKHSRRFVTTDYVLDETATLLRAHGYAHLLPELFHSVLDSDVCRVEWMDARRFRATWQYFQRRNDQEWSFTDCFSFWLMGKLELREALTKDGHFEHAGFKPLLVLP